MSPRHPVTLSGSVLVGELRSFLAERLPDYMIPSAFVELDALPLTPNGKVDRRALPAPEHNRAEAAPALLAARDAVELQLIRIWEQVLDVRPIGVGDNFFELGGHSLLALQLQTLIQQHFDQQLPIAAILEAPTIERLAPVLRRQTDDREWPPLVAIRESGALPPLFLVSPGAGDVLCYHLLAEHLGADQPVYALQAPSMAWEQEPYPRVEDMAARYVDELLAVQPEGPYSVGGWSFGGTIALEMAQQLQRHGHSVALLVLLDTFVPKDLGGFDALSMFTYYARHLDLPIDQDALRRLDYEDQLSYFLEQVRRAEILPPQIELSQMRRVLNITRVNAHVSAAYDPQPYEGRVAFFRARQRGELIPDVDPTIAWSQICSRPLETHTIPGTHQTFLAEPHVKSLARQLKASLAGARSGETRGSGGLWSRLRRRG